MNEAINVELQFFLISVLSGSILLLAYDILRIMRRLMKHDSFFIALEDMVFWVGASLFIFSMMYKENDGIIRGFSIIGMAIGMILYHNIIDDHFVNLIVKVVNTLISPFVFVFKKINKFIGFLLSKVKKFMNFITRQLKNRRKSVKITLEKRKQATSVKKQKKLDIRLQKQQKKKDIKQQKAIMKESQKAVSSKKKIEQNEKKAKSTKAKIDKNEKNPKSSKAKMEQNKEKAKSVKAKNGSK